MDYDPLLAKLAVFAPSREEAIARMKRALDEYHIAGITTNLGFFRRILDDAQFRSGQIHTGFIEEFFARSRPPERTTGAEHEALAVLAAAIFSLNDLPAPQTHPANSSRWLSEGRRQLLQ
jgi:acetyl/propionyl-CoA carboxylase alpha subunit